MSRNIESDRYRPISIALHWLTVALIVTAYATMEFRGIFPRGSDGRALMKAAHFSAGLTVFGLVWIRAAVRLVSPTPVDTAAGGLARFIAAAVHLCLYAIMAALPLLGWAILSAEGKPVPFFAWELPPLIAPSHSRAGMIKELHETIATFGYPLIGLHAAAALFHHYVLHDATLRRMLPRRA